MMVENYYDTQIYKDKNNKIEMRKKIGLHKN